MIVVKHFQSERTEKTPSWKALEDYLNQYHIGTMPIDGPPKPTARIMSMTGYPSGPFHNLVVIIDVDKITI